MSKAICGLKHRVEREWMRRRTRRATLRHQALLTPPPAGPRAAELEEAAWRRNLGGLVREAKGMLSVDGRRFNDILSSPPWTFFFRRWGYPNRGFFDMGGGI